MSLHIIEYPSDNVLELEVSGKLVANDFQSLESMFQSLLKQHGKISVLLSMHDFHGWEPIAFWDEVKFDLKHFGDIKRLAIVGDTRWENFLSVFARPFTGAEMRYFDKAALPEARAWVEENSV